MTKRQYSLSALIMLITLFLFSIDFMLEGITILYIGSFLFFLSRKNIKIRFDFTFLILILFSMTFLLFGIRNDNSSLGSLITRGFGLPLGYLIGVNIIKDTKLVNIRNILLLIALGMALHGIINFIYNIYLFSFSESIGIARSYDFWSRSISAATAQATKFTFLASVSLYFIFFNKGRKTNLIVILCLIVASIYNLQLGGRTYFLLLIFSSVIILSYTLINITKDSKTFLKTFLILIILFISFNIAYNHNFLNSKIIFESSYFYRRFLSISAQNWFEDNRIERKIQYLRLLFDYPFGGRYISQNLNIGYSHELWLDIFDSSGILSYLFILIYSYLSINRLRKLVVKKNVESKYKLLLILFYLLLNLQFFLEPIMDGSPKLIIAYCIVDGMLTTYLYKSRVGNVAVKMDGVK